MSSLTPDDVALVHAAELAGAAERWVRLRSWTADAASRAELESITWAFEPWSGSCAQEWGRAYVDRGTPDRPVRACLVRVTGVLAEDLGTVLHEIAHHAAGLSRGHGVRWRVRLVQATREVCGLSIEAGPRYLDLVSGEPSLPADQREEVDKMGARELDRRVVAHIAAWMERTGERARLESLGVRVYYR